MRHLFSRAAERIRAFMSGRYGSDEVTVSLSFLYLILVLLSLYRPLSFLVFPAAAVALWSLFRIFSKNIPARRKERDAFVSFFSSVRKKVDLLKHKIADRKTHSFFTCPSCGAAIRIEKPPRGRVISIECPKCRTRFDKKT